MPENWNDGRLLAALREAVRARQVVPDGFVEAAKNAFAWHNIDAELAQLSYDSSVDAGRSTLVRSETASIRTLTFSSARLSVELEVADGCLLGQIIPAREGTVETQTRTGAAATAAVDVTGCFTIDPIPDSPGRPASTMSMPIRPGTAPTPRHPGCHGATLHGGRGAGCWRSGRRCCRRCSGLAGRSA